MKLLLALSPADFAAGSGIYPGPTKTAVPLWQEGDNVAFRENGFARINGAGLLRGPTLYPPRNIKQAYIGGNFAAQRAYIATNVEVMLYAYENGAWLTNKQIWVWQRNHDTPEIETWGIWLVGSDQVNQPFLWKNTVGAGTLWQNLPFNRVKVLKKKQNMMLAMNTDNIGDMGIEWNDPRSLEAEISPGLAAWTPAAENRAGNAFLRDLDSEIIAAHDIGDNLAVYSKSALVLGNYVGGNVVWSWKKRAEVGAMGRHSVVPVGPYNYGLTEFGIWKTDGNSATWLADDPVITWLKANLNPLYKHLAWGLYDDVLRCITWHFADNGGLWRSISYHPASGFFTKGNLQLAAGARKEVFGYPLVASALTYHLGAWQETTTHFGADIAWSLKTKPFDFGDRQRAKYLQMVRADGEWDATTMLRIRVHSDPNSVGTAFWDAPLLEKNFPEREGRYFTFEFYGTKPARMSGLEFFGQVAGPEF